MRRLLLAVLLALAATPATVTAGAAAPAKALFGARNTPAEMPTASIGSYARGCLAGAVELPETGPGWQVMRPGRNRSWGAPALIAFIERLAAEARGIGWPRLLIGDMSQPRGGPMETGHASHQIGLDVDIWLRPGDGRAYTRDEREKIGSPVLVADDRRSLTDGWTPLHRQLLKLAASDPAVERIFVNAAIKRRLCQIVPPGPGRAWLAKLRPWWGHAEHFHVRLACPPSAATCIDQPPVPPGDGCDAALAWWFTDEALHPKRGPHHDLTMADLPPACSAVLAE